mmetsp:Transcript_69841/g.158471  ORF Transcript_69841/g.158471 Transcript_69841/m.158471 type:complete len:315 (+) Transcript_69841:94-1038(+)
MFFLLSGALRFHAKPVTECALRTQPRLASKAKLLAQELRRLEHKDIKKQLHVNDALAKQYAKHLSDFERVQPVSCCSLYDTKLFNTLDAASFDEDDADWANSHIRILSGLYGLLRPFDEIQTLSLPVGLGTKLTTTKGKFLRDYWREHIQKELSEGLQKLYAPVMVNCAAPEDTAEIIDLEVFPAGTQIMTVNFKTIDKGDIGPAQGQFLQWALQNRCMTIEDLMEFRGDTSEEGTGSAYRVLPKESGPDTITFEEDIGEGSHGGWSKKLAEYSGSKKKFIKEQASGKERYKRTEINKALKNDSKKKRAAHVVY